MTTDLAPIIRGAAEMPWQTFGQWLLVVIVAGYLLSAITKTSFVRRLGSGLEDILFSNWRLATLGATGIVLSLASGWRTWDGMRNFTQEPLLSFMITFGIQGVLLVVAWLIGETFASGMSTEQPGTRRRGTDALIGAALGIVTSLAALVWALHVFGAISWTDGPMRIDTSRVATVGLYFTIGLIIVAIVFFNRQSQLTRPYLQGTRIIVRSAVLWVMFLACMGTSVFFAFDSFFNAIFPQDQRQRVSEIRAINQVAGVVSDIGSRIQTQQADEAAALFNAPAWRDYERRLDDVARLASEAPGLIREQIARELEAQKQRVAALEERRASAQSGQGGLTTRKTALTEELARLTSERPESATAVQQQKAVVLEIEKRLDEQRAKVLAEEKGVEGSGKVGRGQVWRATRADEERIQSELQVARERMRAHDSRLTGLDRRLATIRSELAQIDGELAKLRGESETAAQMIAVAKSAAGGDAQSFDPGTGLAGLERERQNFRRHPEQQTLANIQSACSALAAASSKVTTLKDRTSALDCDPGQAGDAAQRVFALNRGLAAFNERCSGGDKLPQAGTDTLIEFGRRCLADSGLSSREGAELAARLSSVDLNRDDKAHRFVVTLNAFADGNRLAYLALAIAIGLDTLIFMSGLFGANAVRSPLSDVPSPKARSGRQLEAIIDTALIPHKFDTARLVLGAMRPMTQNDGYMARITLDDSDPHAPDIRRVLNAGASIGAVRHTDGGEHSYEVRAEFYEYLSAVAKREFESNHEHVGLAELERTLSVALLPDIADGADTVLHFLHPIQEKHGFMAEVFLRDVEAADQQSGRGDLRIVRNALNAGAAFERVQRAAAGHYFIHADYYKALLRIRARLLSSSGSRPAVADQGMRAPALTSPHSLGASPSLMADASPRTSLPKPDQRPGAETDNEVRRQFRDDLIRAIGLDPATARQIEDAETHRMLTEAWSALQSRAATNTMLRALVDHWEEHYDRNLDEAYSELVGATNGDRRKRALLDAVVQDIEDLDHALLLMPASGLVHDLIQQLERAAESDDGISDGEQMLKEALVEVRDRLSRPGRVSAATWGEVRRLIEGAVASQSPVVKFKRV